MMDRIIAVNSNCYHGYSIEEAIAGIKAAGFKYIELTATKGWTEHVFPDQSFERLLEVKDLLDEAGLIPFAMSGHTNLMDTERIPDFVKNICEPINNLKGDLLPAYGQHMAGLGGV